MNRFTLHSKLDHISQYDLIYIDEIYLIYIKLVLSGNLEAIIEFRAEHEKMYFHDEIITVLTHTLNIINVHEYLMADIKKSGFSFEEKLVMTGINKYEFEMFLKSNKEQCVEPPYIIETIDACFGLEMSIKYCNFELIEYFSNKCEITILMAQFAHSGFNEHTELITHEIVDKIFKGKQINYIETFSKMMNSSYEIVKYWVRQIIDTDKVPSCNLIVKEIMKLDKMFIATFIINMINHKMWNIVNIFSKITFALNHALFKFVFEQIMIDLSQNTREIAIELVKILKNTWLFTIDKIALTIAQNLIFQQDSKIDYRQYIDILYPNLKEKDQNECVMAREYTLILQIAIWYDDVELINKIIEKAIGKYNFIDTLNACIYVAIQKNNRELINRMFKYGATNYEGLILGAVDTFNKEQDSAELFNTLEYIYVIGAKNFGMLHEVGCSCQYSHLANAFTGHTDDEIINNIIKQNQNNRALSTIAKFIFSKYKESNDKTMFEWHGTNYYNGYVCTLEYWAVSNNFEDIFVLID